MIKIVKSIFIALALVTFANAATKISQDEIKEIEALTLFKGAQVKVNQGYDAGSIYVLNVSVRGNADKVFLTKDKKYLISGDVLSTQTGQPLEVPVDISITKEKEAFTYGTGKDEYVLFTDPECPYCKQFESYFHEIEDKVKIRVFFFPLQSHPNAKDISLYIMSQKSYEDKKEAMTTVTKDTPAFVNRKIDAKELDKLKANLADQMMVANKLGIRGTPSVYDAKGNKVSWVEMLQGYGVTVK
jgi:thiol:disulfide interchange protein DsbC